MAFTKVTNAGIGSTNTVLLHNLNVVGTVTATDGIFSGIGSFGGNVSVGGVLTYEDVTNVDSVGLITARNGITVLGAGVTIAAGGLNVNAGVSTFGGNVTVGSGITLSPDGDGYYTGIVTATTFKGALTGSVTGAATKVTVTDQTGDTSCNVLFTQGATGDQFPHSTSSLTFNSSSGALTATSYSGDGSNLTGIDATQIVTGNTSVQTVDTGSDGHVKVTTEGTERLRIDSGGRILIGSTANSHNGGDLLQLSAASSTASIQLNRYTANAHPSYINFFKSRNASVSGQTVVQDGDTLGLIAFYGSDGTDRSLGAEVCAQVDGTPGSDDMPSRLVFRTSADGSQSPTERIRIDSTGRLLVSGQAALTSTSLSHPLQIAASNVADTVALIGRASDDISELSFYEADKSTKLGEIQYRTDHANIRHRVGSLRWCANGTTENMRLTNITVGSVTTGVLGINDTSPEGEALALTVKSKNYQESALPVVHIERMNSAGGGSSVDEIALNCRIATTYNGAGDSFAIKSYGCHNLNSTHYAGYFEAKGSQYSAGGDGAGVYAEITKTDTNGGGYVPAGFFYGKHTYNASDTGWAMGIRVKVQALTKNTGIQIHHENTNSDWTPMIRFCKGGSETEVGTIKSSDTATQYNTSSDYRLKENVVDLTGAITRLKQLKPKRFNFKRATGTTVDGFIAHEVEPVVPQAVSGTKDATKIETVQDPSTGKTIMLEDGTPKLQTVIDPQEVDYSKLSTLTIAALQEALAKIETLETKVAALESS